MSTLSRVIDEITKLNVGEKTSYKIISTNLGWKTHCGRLIHKEIKPHWDGIIEEKREGRKVFMHVIGDPTPLKSLIADEVATKSKIKAENKALKDQIKKEQKESGEPIKKAAKKSGGASKPKAKKSKKKISVKDIMDDTPVVEEEQEPAKTIDDQFDDFMSDVKE